MLRQLEEYEINQCMSLLLLIIVMFFNDITQSSENKNKNLFALMSFSVNQNGRSIEILLDME